MIAALALTCACATPAIQDRSQTLEAPLGAGATWSADVPANWNGVLLLHSRGYAAQAGRPEPAPERYRAALLGAGYALAASNYGAGGWSVAEAVPAQERTVVAFSRRYGKPRRVLGYGFSMGGLVTTALAERSHPALDGAIALCSSMAGSLAMMNMGLDGAFAFRTLLAPRSDVELVGISDDRANAARVAAAAQLARQSPQGRARMALAATLAGIPAWVPPKAGESDEDLVARQAGVLAASFPMGVFLPRSEQERRADGVFSWNVGVDYREQLRRSGREAFVRRLYRDAGLDLDADLTALAGAPRVSASPGAVDYMAEHYIPSGSPKVPLLALQALGDPVTSPSLQEGYAAVAPTAMVQSLFVAQGGHCEFTPEQMLEAVARVAHRLDSGRWPAPAALHDPAHPAALLRPCFQGDRCPGRPRANKFTGGYERNRE
jgi:alpha-beta hydrolase superfamily lysophospholipase